MQNGTATIGAETPRGRDRRRANRLSKDGRWRSFPRVPHLLQYVSSGTYYARVKVGGKIIRQSLETNVWTTAKLKLVDFLKDKREDSAGGNVPLFSEAVALYKASVLNDPSMKERSKAYRLICIRKIETSWSEVWTSRLDEIAPDACREWAMRLRQEIASQYFNNVIGTFRLICDAGIAECVRQGGKPFSNLAAELSRVPISQKELRLPEPDQFRSLVELIRDGSSWGRKAGDLVEFLAYSGTRLYTEAQWVTWEDVDWQRKEIIVRGDPQTHTKNWEVRRIPMLPDMEILLNRMKAERGSQKGRVLEIVECPVSLRKACSKLGIPRLRHHDLRHLFATRCIESGVDIPTVARWLGHKDGGALAMRVYGHLRNEHSRAMAEKVKF